MFDQECQENLKKLREYNKKFRTIASAPWEVESHGCDEGNSKEDNYDDHVTDCDYDDDSDDNDDNNDSVVVVVDDKKVKCKAEDMPQQRRRRLNSEDDEDEYFDEEYGYL